MTVVCANASTPFDGQIDFESMYARAYNYLSFGTLDGSNGCNH